jgi:hypothetical protein
MPVEVKKEIQLEIAHVLFIDIVGYSKLSVKEQHAVGSTWHKRVRDCGDAGHILLFKHVARRSGRIPEVATALARSWFVRSEAWRARLGREPL